MYLLRVLLDICLPSKASTHHLRLQSNMSLGHNLCIENHLSICLPHSKSTLNYHLRFPGRQCRMSTS